MTSQFYPARGLSNCHLQTLFPRFNRPNPWVETQCQWFATPDGDRLALHTPKPLTDDPDRPIVLILHGLEGSVESAYVQGVMSALLQARFQPAVMHFRGCGGIPNLLPRAYHSGDSEDPRWLAQQLTTRFPATKLLGVGYSLGGNVLLKWLGEDGTASPLSGAVSVSAPLDLHACSRRIGQGLSRIYQRHLLNSLRDSLRRKSIDPKLAEALPDLSDNGLFRDFRVFDDSFTAPLHGYRDVIDYYNRASSKPLLNQIARPTTIIHALDDPFICQTAVPSIDEVSDQVSLEVSERGGHVGFVSGAFWRPEYWLESRIPAILEAYR